MEEKIIKCVIRPQPHEVEGKHPQVYAALSNNKKVRLFSFNPDEFVILENDLIGLTEVEAFMVRARKENIYLTK